MSTSPDTISQRSEIVKSPAGDFTVRRMYWKKQVAFVAMLAKHFAGLKDIIAAARSQPLPPADDSLKEAPAAPDLVTMLLPRLVDLITSVDELSEHLIMHSADLDQDRLEKLDAGDALEIIRVALKLNTGDDLKKSCAGIAAQIGGLMAISAKSGAGSTTS